MNLPNNSALDSTETNSLSQTYNLRTERERKNAKKYSTMIQCMNMKDKNIQHFGIFAHVCT